MAYVRSSSAQAMLAEPGLLRLTRFVEQELRDRGAIHITKDSGLFEATKEAGN